MAFPYQGTVGNHQNPTLLPNFFRPVAGGGGISLTSPKDFMARYPTTASNGSVVIGGTLAAGDVVTVAITNPVLGSGAIDIAYTVTATDTAASIAYELAQGIMANATLQRFGFTAEADPLTDALLVYQASAVGNFSTLVFSTTGAETGTVTQMTGGAGPITPIENFIFAGSGGVQSFWFGIPVAVGYALLSQMVNQGLPVR